MEMRLTALENRLRQAERALVLERLARQTAEVAQQTVETWPAGVDAEEIGTLPMFSGDSDLNSRVNSMPWSQWSLTIWIYFGKFNQTATRLLQRVGTNVEDPIIADNTTMTRAEIRLSIQLNCVLALTCRKRALQVVQQVPRGYGFEAWRHLFSEGEKNAAVFFSPLILEHFWPASTLLHGHLALAIPSLPETDHQILERWGYADEVHLGKSVRAKDFGLECLRDVQRLS